MANAITLLQRNKTSKFASHTISYYWAQGGVNNFPEESCFQQHSENYLKSTLGPKYCLHLSNFFTTDFLLHSKGFMLPCWFSKQFFFLSWHISPFLKPLLLVLPCSWVNWINISRWTVKTELLTFSLNISSNKLFYHCWKYCWFTFPSNTTLDSSLTPPPLPNPVCISFSLSSGSSVFNLLPSDKSSQEINLRS